MTNENMVHIYIGILFSCRDNEIMTFTGKWVELENITLSEVTKTQKDKQCILSYFQVLASNL